MMARVREVMAASIFATAYVTSQYFQIARGYSPTEAGLLTIPMMGNAVEIGTVTRIYDHIQSRKAGSANPENWPDYEI